MIRIGVFRRAAGFTLMEIIVVVAIIGMAAAVAIPFFSKLSRRQRLISSAHEIQSSLMAARVRAVNYNRAVNLTITEATGSESLHKLQADPVIPLPTPPPTSPTPGPMIAWINANEVSFVATPTGGKVTFSAEGRMISETVPTPSIITVQGPVGSPVTNQVTIRTDSMGKVKIVTPVAWQ